MKNLSKQSDTTLFWIMLIIIVYGFKIIGLAPFSQETDNTISTQNSRKSGLSRVYRFSKIGLAYNILLVILLQVVAALVYLNLDSLSFPISSRSDKLMNLVLPLVYFLTTNFIIIYFGFRQNNAVSIMNRLSEIHHLVSNIEQQHLFNEKTLLSNTVHIIFNFSLWIAIVMTDSTQPSDLVYVTWLTCSTLFSYGFIVEYSMVVGFLARKLEQVNSILMKLDELSNYLSRTSSGYNTYSSVPSLSTHDSKLANLQLLCAIRTMLCDLSQDIADFFSFPILLSTGSSFFIFLFNVYFLISFLWQPLDARFNQRHQIFNTILRTLAKVYPLTMLSFNVTKVQAKAKMTGRIVSKLLVTPMRQEMKAKLEQFSLQLLHENISFTACGLFSLDFTMLYSMFGAAATYLVIIVQFQQTSGNASSTTS